MSHELTVTATQGGGAIAFFSLSCSYSYSRNLLVTFHFRPQCPSPLLDGTSALYAMLWGGAESQMNNSSNNNANKKVHLKCISFCDSCVGKVVAVRVIFFRFIYVETPAHFTGQ